MSRPKQPKLICTLGVSRRDFTLARLWLKWGSFLCTKPGGDSHKETLVVVMTRNITLNQQRELEDTVIVSPGMFEIEWVVCPDEDESGYPKSASHLFLRTLEYVERKHPGCPALWCESDTVATRPGWFQEIAAEYAQCGKPFMGVKVSGHGHDHMTGNAVYSSDWRERSRLLANVLDAPDLALWGVGKGQAFDTYSAKDVVPQMHDCKTIQQIWRPQTFTKSRLYLVEPETCLFHQCKDGSLNIVLAEMVWPEFIALLPLPTRFFRLHGHNSRLKQMGVRVQFDYSKFRPGIGWACVTQPATAIEEMTLVSLCGRHGITEVDQADFLKLGGKVRKAQPQPSLV